MNTVQQNANQIKKLRCWNTYPRVKRLVQVGLICGFYFTWSILFYGYYEDIEPLDAIYFAVVTMSTVGYGDISASDDVTSELVTVLFIFFGIVVVFGEVSKVVSDLMAPFFACVRNMLDRRFPQQSIDLDGDGGSQGSLRRF